MRLILLCLIALASCDQQNNKPKAESTSEPTPVATATLTPVPNPAPSPVPTSTSLLAPTISEGNYAACLKVCKDASQGKILNDLPFDKCKAYQLNSPDTCLYTPIKQSK